MQKWENKLDNSNHQEERRLWELNLPYSAEQDPCQKDIQNSIVKEDLYKVDIHPCLLLDIPLGCMAFHMV